jgi:UDP-glucuronate 4-epimerase
MKILVTGAAGFIGFHLVQKLLSRNDEVIGLDSINEYYDQRLKYGRLNETGIKQDAISYGSLVQSKTHKNYRFIQLKLEDKSQLDKLFQDEKFDAVCHLAAQAGVRYSIENPLAYIDSNIVGFINILEACRHFGVRNLSFASSSSVYGLNENYPFSTSDNVDHPISLYAATKKSNELMAHTYAHLYGIHVTGLRFFTVYGPWGRPDMALFLFTKAALEGKSIDVYNNGEMLRDFTYIDDVVEAVVRVIEHPAQPDENWTGVNPQQASSSAPYRIYNIGSNRPVKLMEFIDAIENAVGFKIRRNMLPMQAADLPATFADVADLIRDMKYKPDTDLQAGVSEFVEWYKGFYEYT